MGNSLLSKLASILFIVAVINLVFINASYSYSIRIGIQKRITNATIGAYDQAVLFDGNTQKAVIKIKQLQKYIVYSVNNKVYIKNGANGEFINTGSNSIIVTPVAQDSFVYAKGRWYRGNLKLIAKGNSITVVNVLELEEYLKGVVPSEMPASWNNEALKAQAIVARSYAYANLNKRGSEGFDLLDTPHDQAYNGMKSETQNSSLAVVDTKDQVLVSNNKIVSAYYHSSSGGITEDQAWNSKIAYVKCVRDFDYESPSYSWNKTFNLTTVSQRLSSVGYSVGKISDILPVERSESGRVKKLKIVGSEGTKIINFEKLNSIFKLPSSLFNINVLGNSINIAGKGNGHGVGMSQWGAKTLADNGFTVYQILSYYYNNIEIRKVS